MEEIEPLSVEDAFGDLKDPRSRSPEHQLSELLVVAIAAILSGADSWVGIATWCCLAVYLTGSFLRYFVREVGRSPG